MIKYEGPRRAGRATDANVQRGATMMRARRAHRVRTARKMHFAMRLACCMGRKAGPGQHKGQCTYYHI
eukprot:5421343-Pyramimonas_sp.AAC.1